MQVLLFTLGDARCALALTALTRVLPAAALTPVPGAPACVAGLLDLHGTAVPVLDLGQLAGGAPAPVWRDSRILLLPVPPSALRAAALADAAVDADTDAVADAAVDAAAAAAPDAAAPDAAAPDAAAPDAAANAADAATVPNAAAADAATVPYAAAADAAAVPGPVADATVLAAPAALSADFAGEVPRQIGLLAEHVLGVVRIDPAALADSGVARAPFVGRVVATADGLLQLIEPAGLLTPALRAALSWPEAA